MPVLKWKHLHILKSLDVFQITWWLWESYGLHKLKCFFFNIIQMACPLLARFKFCPIAAKWMWTKSGGFHCCTTHASTLMVAQSVALTHYLAYTPPVCSLIQNTCAEGQKETVILKWLNGKCAVASKTLQNVTHRSAAAFSDTRLALTKCPNHMLLHHVYMHLCSLIGYEVSSEFKPWSLH